MFQSVLVVCVGNICRSPMAEALARAALPAGTRVESAGLAALVGYPADPTAVALMAERNIDITGHRARQFTPAMAREFELLLAMEAGHVREIERVAPEARGRVFRIGNWGNFDVADPYRRERAAFERALADIERGLADLKKALRLE